MITIEIENRKKKWFRVDAHSHSLQVFKTDMISLCLFDVICLHKFIWFISITYVYAFEIQYAIQNFYILIWLSFLSGTPSSISFCTWFRSGGLFHDCTVPRPNSKNANEPPIYVAAKIPNTICHCPYVC